MTQATREGEIDPQTDINLIVESLDRLSAIAHEQDPAQKLRLYQAIGAIAGGVSEARLVFGVQTKPERKLPDQPTSVSVIPTNEQPETNQGIKSPKSDTVEKTGTLALIGSDVEIRISSTPEEVADVDVINRVKNHFSELNLSNKEVDLMISLCKKTDQYVKTADVIEGLTGSGNANKQAFSRLIRTIRESSYRASLEVVGETNGRRYKWSNHGFELDQSLAQTEAEISSTSEVAVETPTTSTAETEQELNNYEASLAKVGITHDKETDSLSVRGVPLKLSKLATEIILYMSRNNNATVFKDLVTNKDLMPLQGSKAAMELQTALAAIDGELKRYDVAWRDVKVPGEPGKMIRRLELGTHNVPTKSEVRPFLVEQQ